MRRKTILLFLLFALLLSACGQTTQMGETITLLNQNSEEVSFPQEKPTLFFFVTTYT